MNDSADSNSSAFFRALDAIPSTAVSVFESSSSSTRATSATPSPALTRSRFAAFFDFFFGVPPIQS